MTRQPSTRRAAAWVSGWLLMMLVIIVAGREAMRTLHVFQLMEMRSLLGLVLLYPLMRREGGFAAMRTARLGQHIARNSFHYAAQFGWFFALTLISVAEVVAIEFTMPVWTAILAASFLGERMSAGRLAAVALGVAGVAIIVRPGLGQFDPGQMIALGAAVGFAIAMILVKSLTKTESVVVILFWMLVIQSAIGLVPAVLVWRETTAAAWPWVLLIAFCGTYSHYCMIQALGYADATTVVPMDFLRVPLSAVVGWLVYAEAIDLYTALGAGLILFGNLINLRSPAPRVSETRTAP